MSYKDVTDSGAVREELRRIVASPLFEEAGRLVRFLSFVVNETLEGKGGLLKESVIGVEVFGRTTGYDPKIDPIVRVQARRLRTKLDAWYQNGGKGSVIRIALPKGGYEPEFSRPPSETSVVAPPLRQLRMAWMLVIPAIIVGVGAILLTRPKPPTTVPGSRLFTAYPGYQTSPAFSPDGLTRISHRPVST